MATTGDLRGRVLRNAGARPAGRGESRTYDVRSIEGDPTAAPVVITVTVPAACPAVVGDHRCGMARGEPVERGLHDSHTGKDYTITVPGRHPCGHVTLHRDLIAEDARWRLREAS